MHRQALPKFLWRRPCTSSYWFASSNAVAARSASLVASTVPTGGCGDRKPRLMDPGCKQRQMAIIQSHVAATQDALARCQPHHLSCVRAGCCLSKCGAWAPAPASLMHEHHTGVAGHCNKATWREMGCGGSSAVAVRDSDMSGEPDPYFDLIVDESLQRNEWPAEKEKKHRKDEKQSLMLKAMDKDMFERLKGHKTAVAGWTIARAINTGIMYPGSFVGCHAGDLESYTDYKELFNPVIEGYHKGFKMDGSCRHVTDLDSSKMANMLTEGAKKRIVSTRIRVARNLAMFPLNPGGTKETRIQIADLMEKVFTTLENDLGGQFFRHSNMTPEEEKQLVDDHFLFKGRDMMQAASGYHQHWPAGRGIFLNAEKTFLLWINEGDHCRIISMEQGGDVKRVFDRLARGITAIENGVKKVTGKETAFMTHDILGCITCCPSNIGTGMRGSVHIKVPMLIAKHGLDGIDGMCREKNCQARGTMGEHTQVIDRIDVSNWRRLGFPEFQLVDNMIETVNLLAQMEEDLEKQA